MNPSVRGLEQPRLGCRARRRLCVLAALILGLSAFSGGALAFAADCTDADGDGYSVEGGACGPVDCNDSNAAIHPGAAEICGDGLDNDCDGNVDFDLGADCGVADGLCQTNGIKQCTDDKTGTFCKLSGPLKLSSPEGPAPSASCFDGKDNDCNGKTDHQEPGCQTAELCNGFDDNGNGVVDEGFPLGTACKDGKGACERTGTLICASDGGTQCSVAAGTPGVEGPAGGVRCRDGVDNDCDGSVDLADQDCQTAEVCDGLDNDGDGDVDEDFALGEPCTKGIGICETAGVTVCSADGSGTTCSAPAKLGSAEGPAGATCTDKVDNDCDGLVDADDPGCGAAALRVVCALPDLDDHDDHDDHDHHGFASSDGGHDDHDGHDDHHELSCDGKQRIYYSALHAGPNAVITAELVGLDKLGNIALDKKGKPLPVLTVHKGDTADLRSSIKGNYVAYTKPGDDDDDGHGHFSRDRKPPKPPKPPTHVVTAPVPLLRVTVQDGGRSRRRSARSSPTCRSSSPTTRW